MIAGGIDVTEEHAIPFLGCPYLIFSPPTNFTGREGVVLCKTNAVWHNFISMYLRKLLNSGDTATLYGAIYRSGRGPPMVRDKINDY